MIWDKVKCCVTTDVEVSDEYIKSHKGVACSHDKPFPRFDDLYKISGKNRATGHGTIDFGEDVVEEKQRNSPIDVEGLEDIVEETQQTASVNCNVIGLKLMTLKAIIRKRLKK